MPENPDEEQWPVGPPGSRFAAVTRRAFLQRSAAVVGVVAVGGLAACGTTNDDKALSSPTTAAGTATTAATGGSTPTTSGGTAASGALPSGAELAVAFTYTPSDTFGRVENPYVAVWIEDTAGALQAVLGLWYQSGRKEHYLSELTRWSSLGAPTAAVDAVSSATRTPGDYALVWNGADVDGARAAQGQHYVCIEAAREHGPYSLIRQAVTLGAAASKVALASDGELSGASADYRLA